MKVTGYQLREAIGRWRLKRDVAEKQFVESVWAFADDDKDKPENLMAAFAVADTNIAILQTLQQQFNLTTPVNVAGTTYTLSVVIKLVGGAGRMEKLWRSIATDNTERRYGYEGPQKTRDASEERAKRQISTKDTVEFADKAGRHSSALRNAIATGNANTIDVPDDFPANLFD